MPTLKTYTLGCKVNQYETQYVRQGLQPLGYRDAQPGERVDLCVVNSCTVTGTAAAKSRKAIRQLAREHPEAEIVVMGCYATEAADEVAAMPGVVEVVTDKRRLGQLLERFGAVEVPSGIDTFDHRHRAYVKVQDGCHMACSYCIIPHVRPVLTSRPRQEVLDEVARLAGRGHREIVLTGIHLGHYGVDLDASGPRLAELVEAIVGLDAPLRVRISSIEAVEATDVLLEVMAAHPRRVCAHLHLSMQSGSDRILKQMNRRWGAGPFLQRCRAIAERLDRPALTTDVIVGFPGETDDDFAATCRVVEEVGFSKVHVFPFSPRRGTPAATMPEQVPAAVKRRRAEELSTLAERLRGEYFASLVGNPLQVLVEHTIKEKPGRLLGTADRYVPVELPGEESLIGQLVDVRAAQVADGQLLGELLEPAPCTDGG